MKYNTKFGHLLLVHLMVQLDVLGQLDWPHS